MATRKIQMIMTATIRPRMEPTTEKKSVKCDWTKEVSPYAKTEGKRENNVSLAGWKRKETREKKSVKCDWTKEVSPCANETKRKREK